MLKTMTVKSNEINWIGLQQGISYPESLNFMMSKVCEVIADNSKIYVLFAEYEPLYTLGSSASEDDLTAIGDIPFFYTDRGGKVTYHGPGQLVVYPVIHLSRFNYDIKAYVKFLQDVVVDTLTELGVKAYACNKNIGVWTLSRDSEQKIVSIGIKVKKWVAYHGFAVNIATDLANFHKIIACGLKNGQQTSLQELGYKIENFDFIELLQKKFVGRM